MEITGELSRALLANSFGKWEELVKENDEFEFGRYRRPFVRLVADGMVYVLGNAEDKKSFIGSLEFDLRDGTYLSTLLLDDVRDLILLSNESLGLLGDIKIKWLNEWFDEQKQQKQEPTPEVQPSPSSSNADDVTPPDTSTIMELMLLDDEEQKQRLLATLHKLVDGKKGKHVALVFLICEKCGLMNKPTHNILTSIFGDIGAKSGYNNYYSKGLSYYKQEQIKGVETHILPFVNGH